MLLLNADDGTIAKDLLCNHRSSVLTVVNMRCANLRFKDKMRELIHEQLKFAFIKSERSRSTSLYSQSCSPNNNWSVVKNRIMDSAIPILEKMNPEKGPVPSVTREKKKRKLAVQPLVSSSQSSHSRPPSKSASLCAFEKSSYFAHTLSLSFSMIVSNF